MYNLKLGKIMAKLLDLVESHPDVIVSIRAADLLAANEELIRRTRQELEQLITDANTETYPSAKKVAEVSKTGEKQAKKPKSTRAKAKQPTEKITPASILKKLIAFGKDYQIEEEQDFREAARIYSEEAALIAQMRKRLKDEGLTVMKTYKTGECEVAHPLLSELPRHVESANKCLMTISSMIEERGAKRQKPTRDLDQFRLHA